MAQATAAAKPTVYDLFSSVRSADRIYVLKHGQLVEQGTDAELFTLQAAGYLTEPATVG